MYCETRYFSYEHFYVIYCKFWELDTDHDFLIDKENLMKYGNHALTYRIVDRIFSQVSSKKILICLHASYCKVIASLNINVINQFLLRLLGSSLAKLKGKWGMRILSISYLPKKINRQSLALNIGKL